MINKKINMLFTVLSAPTEKYFLSVLNKGEYFEILGKYFSTVRTSIFLNKIQACQVSNHSLRNEINVVHTFRDIEVQSWPFGIV